MHRLCSAIPIFEFLTVFQADWESRDSGNKPPESWPDQGKVEFLDYTTRYREGLELVLKGIQATVKEGEKVGIVGRTGAGTVKSRV